MTNDAWVKVGSLVLGVFIPVSAGVVMGCGGDNASSQTAQMKQAETALRALPYRYRLRDVEAPPGAAGAIAGRATDRHGVGVDFAVTVGSPKTVAVPLVGKGAAQGFEGSAGHPAFNFNTNAFVRPPGEPRGQAAARGDIAEKLVQALCKQYTGKRCPV